MDQAFIDAMTTGYALDEPAIVVGGPMLGGQPVVGADGKPPLGADGRPLVRVALSMLNRHGLVAGATGTGKTKTLQALAGQMSNAGIPCFIADIKGDVTGMAQPGDPSNPRVAERCTKLGWQMQPAGHPVELLSLTGKLGVPVRASVHSFGPVLLAKVLDLNDTQTAVLSLVFAYCDDNGLPLLDLADLRTTVTYLASDDGKEVMAEYGGIAPATASVILRALVTLEQQGAKDFFGMPEFDVRDLMRNAPDGRGVVSLLELSDVMDRPRLFSTFMLWLLAQLYTVLPEVGDLPKPKLCFFFDEAHLLFADASPALLEQIERTARLIRSKGVGVYFVTQAPTDVPPAVLGQLGNRFQHALRAFTPQDADDIAKVVRTFPTSPFYTGASDVGSTLTSLGIGEALVTVLSPRGVPTPLAATLVVPPDSAMAALPPEAVVSMAAASPLQAKYGTASDPDSAHEMITRRIADARAAAEADAMAPKPPTAAQLERERARQAREEAAAQAKAQREAEAARRAAERAATAAQKAAEREAAAEARRQAAEQRAQEREAAARQRAAERQQQELIRAGTRIAAPVIRSVFGTLFGGKR